MRVYLCNAPSSHATILARTIVQEHLAACVNMIPGALSIYEWDSVIEEATETVMIIKSSADPKTLTARIIELHPFETPEIICLKTDIPNSHQPYVEWVKQASSTRT